MDMHPPPAFDRLSSCFLSDDYAWGTHNFVEWTKRAIALTHLPPAKLDAVKSYLVSVIDSSDDKYVERVWLSLGAPVAGRVEPRAMLKTVVELLDAVNVMSLPEKS